MNPTYQHFATHDESEYPHLWRGVVGAWAPCLGPSGTRLHDHSGRANWGTLTNMDAATDWVVDGGQYALDFDGSNDYVDCGTLPGFLAGDSFSVGGWFKINSIVSNGGIVVADRGASPGTVGWHCRTLASGAVRWIVYSNNGAWFRGADSPVLSLNEWYFFCGVFNQSGSFLTINRNRYSQTVVSGDFPSISGPSPLWFGRNGSNYGNIKLDDVKIWRREITPSEALSLYEIGRGGMYTPRRRRRAYSFGPSFQAAWARGSNVILQPCGVS